MDQDDHGERTREMPKKSKAEKRLRKAGVRVLTGKAAEARQPGATTFVTRDDETTSTMLYKSASGPTIDLSPAALKKAQTDQQRAALTTMLGANRGDPRMRQAIEKRLAELDEPSTADLVKAAAGQISPRLSAAFDTLGDVGANSVQDNASAAVTVATSHLRGHVLVKNLAGEAGRLIDRAAELAAKTPAERDALLTITKARCVGVAAVNYWPVFTEAQEVEAIVTALAKAAVPAPNGQPARSGQFLAKSATAPTRQDLSAAADRVAAQIRARLDTAVAEARQRNGGR